MRSGTVHAAAISGDASTPCGSVIVGTVIVSRIMLSSPPRPRPKPRPRPRPRPVVPPIPLVPGGAKGRGARKSARFCCALAVHTREREARRQRQCQCSVSVVSVRHADASVVAKARKLYPSPRCGNDVGIDDCGAATWIYTVSLGSLRRSRFVLSLACALTDRSDGNEGSMMRRGRRLSW